MTYIFVHFYAQVDDNTNQNQFDNNKRKANEKQKDTARIPQPRTHDFVIAPDPFLQITINQTEKFNAFMCAP